MTHGAFRVPTPENEPARSYAPGSPERTSLASTVASLSAATIEVPLILGGGGMIAGKCKSVHVVCSSSMDVENKASILVTDLAEYVRNIDGTLSKEVAQLSLSVTKWLVRYRSDLTSHDAIGEVLSATSSLLIHGVLLARRQLLLLYYSHYTIL